VDRRARGHGLHPRRHPGGGPHRGRRPREARQGGRGRQAAPGLVQGIALYPEPRLLTAGDLAVSVEFADAVTPEANARVLALDHLIRQQAVAGIVETVPTFRSLLVYYDPLRLPRRELDATLRALASAARHAPPPPGRLVEIPCCYESDLGPDLHAAATRLGLTPDEIVRLHTTDDYRVYFVGFTPGLPYLAGRSDRLTIPRLDTPRTRVPPGSVGLGGRQCCIYSVESPGGYWLLGRTPLALYDPGRADPILLRAGDRVRFRAIDRAEFDRIAAEVAAGRFVARVEPPPASAGQSGRAG
jgi:KipI family sensor histidine kinase inhibitor